MSRHSPYRCRRYAAAALLAALTTAGCTTLPPAPATTSAAPPAATTASDAAGWQLDWARRAVFYEVFVRSFADSDGDGVGDLAGLTARLDYLNDGDPAGGDDLGVDALWLMPVFASPSYHGYDVTDYEAIDPEYGTLADFERFLDQAHRRGMRVILDLMVNHTSSQHPWFVEASRPGSPRRDWYVWRRDDPGWTQPWGGDNPVWHRLGERFYYGIFWSGMPDLDFRNPEVRAEVERLADLWLDRGVDGFRLDAARHIVADGPGEAQNDTPATHTWWRQLSAHVRRGHPEALLVGENWTDTATIATYYGSPVGSELPMNFDFPGAEAMVAAARHGDAGKLAGTLRQTAAALPPGALSGSFLTNHDMSRLASQLGGDRARLGTAAALLLTLPGTPFLYYGEEVGLADGSAPGDPAKRTPMPWDAGDPGGGFTDGEPWAPFAPGRAAGATVAAQTADPDSLLARYRALIRLRREQPALARGGLEILAPAAGDSGRVLALMRTPPAGTAAPALLVVHNLGDEPAASGVLALPGVERLEPLWSDLGVTATAAGTGGWTVTLAAHASAVWMIGDHQSISGR